MIVFSLWAALAIGQVTLGITSSAPSSAIPSGEEFKVSLQYSCVSTTSDANQAKITVQVPAGLDWVSASNSPQVVGASYDAGLREATITFIDPLPAGSTGDVKINLVFPNGSTPDGFSGTIQSTISASNGTSQISSSTVTAQAQSRLDINKYRDGVSPFGGLTLYGIRICNGVYGAPVDGTLNLSNLSITDQLPTGGSFHGLRGPWDVPSSYDAGTRTASWDITLLEPGECEWLGVNVQYDAPTNYLGEVIANWAYVTGTPLGESSVTLGDDHTHNLIALQKEAKVTKSVSHTQLRTGDYGYYEIAPINEGGSELDDLEVLDTIPAGLDIYRIQVGQFSDELETNHNYVNIDFKTNMNSSWTSAIINEYAYDDEVFELTPLIPNYASGERITVLRWSLGDRNPGFACYNPTVVNFKVEHTASLGTITNCARIRTSTTAVDITEECADLEIIAPYTDPILMVEAEYSSGYSNPVNTNETVAFTGTISNAGNTVGTLQETAVYAILPEGMTYSPGSATVLSASNGNLSPSINHISDLDGSGLEAVLFQWPSGASGIIERDNSISVELQGIISKKMPSGTPSGVVRFIAFGSNTLSDCLAEDWTDIYDLDSDGSTSDNLCSNLLEINVIESTAISAKLSVKGSLDNDFISYPDIGETLPGGVADYQLTIHNEGNAKMTQLKVLDVFPKVGDLSIVAPTSRGSQWGPVLIGPVSAPIGVTVYYSTSDNPCRASDGFVTTDLPGCTAPNWTTVPPTDITSVQSIMFDFGNLEVGPDEEIGFTWPMRTPTDVLSGSVSAGDFAYNSIGYHATTVNTSTLLLPSEPLKTGLQVMALTPGVFGDRVWADIDGDGIQDIGESGINNVKVELYRDNGDGIANVSDDFYESFTITTGDGNFLFPNLTTDDYFLLFTLPPTYTVTAPAQGADPALDSDATSYLVNGRAGAITDVVTITNTTFEYTYDLGLEPSGLAAVGDYVWNDINADGIQDEGATAGINGVVVTLHNSSGTTLLTTTTKDDIYGTLETTSSTTFLQATIA